MVADCRIALLDAPAAELGGGIFVLVICDEGEKGGTKIPENIMKLWENNVSHFSLTH